MAYCSGSDVAALANTLTSGASDFSGATSPMLAAVNFWMSAGCAVIEARLTSAGYDVPPTSNSRGYDWLRELNAVYAVSRAEMSRINVVLGLGERTRGQVMDQMFWRELDRLADLDLSRVGFSRSSTGKLYVGGIRDSDKDEYEDMTDRVKPRFTRGQFGYPGTIRPDDWTAAS